ncbi:MAG: ribonucleoside triphosphate reductase [Candidatus Nealsonbacteria bacterium]
MLENKTKKIKKRDGSIVDFDQTKITDAIHKAIIATGQGNGEVSKKVSDKVVSILNRRFKDGEIPQVEQIQDIIEEVLILEDLVDTAKAYILYREQRRKIRETSVTLDDSVEMVDRYIKELDWQIKENANMSYSLQGLNYYGVSAITKQYWLNKVYPKEIRDALNSGDFHIHDLDNLSTYCCGWDLYDLILRGFGGVAGKIESSPPKHFRTALGQLVNFFYTLQGESAGAQAVSSFDTLLAPFVRYDNLDYKRVKQGLQEFLFNMAIPTRVGFQCLSEDTEILTPVGWKSHNEVKEKDSIYTFNIKNGELEEKIVDNVFAREYKGKMYNLRNRSQNQLISPQHRVVRQIFNADKYILEPIENVLKLKSPISIPVVCENINPDVEISDDQLKLMAWTLSEGTIEKDGSRRVSIYQSLAANQENYNEIVGLLDNFNFEYSSRLQTGLGTCNALRLSPTSSKVLHQWFGETKKVFPQSFFMLSKRQARLFLDTYIKGDGWEEKYRRRITVTDEEFLKALEAIVVLAGYNFSVKERKPQGISKKIQYIITLTEAKHDYIQEIKEVDYHGIIWSVHTENETVIAKRKGQVFVTGNTPFTNITLDIKAPSTLAKQPVIIGGKPQDETYGDFQEEMNMINQAFYEGLMEGDAKGRPFTFPIPTVNIGKDFDWDSKVLEPLWEATAKYGVNYFSNFINSGMDVEDARSMCCRLRLDNRELLRRGGGLFGSQPLTGSVGVVTINLPRIGYLSKTKKDFINRLEKIMDLAKESLEIKRKALDNFMEKGLYPYSKHYLAGVKKMRGSYWGNHFSTIGLLGMNEALLNFLEEDTGSVKGKKFTMEILDFMRDKLVEYQKETGNLYNLEATPAEGASYRLALKDKEKYADIVTAGSKEVPFYTNSTQLPVNYTDDVFEALKLQDEIQGKYTGGTVLHVFLGERISDPAAAKALVKKAFEKFSLPYLTLTPTFSICPVHGYISGEHFECPQCTIKQPCEVYSRIVGYLRPVQQWNNGKKEEYNKRKVFKLSKAVPVK